MRVELSAPGGKITMQQIGVARSQSEMTDALQARHRKMRSENAALMVRAMEVDATHYEGNQTPTAGMAIFCILGWPHEGRSVMRHPRTKAARS